MDATRTPHRRRGIDPVWRRAPLLLLRAPALFAAVAFGSLLLTLAAAAYPLFISATTSDLVRAAVERPSIGRYAAGITYEFRNLPLRPERFDPDRLEGDIRSPRPADIDPAFRRLVAESDLLGPPVRTIAGDIVEVSLPGAGESRSGRLFASSHVLDHVEVLEGAEGDGVWLPDLIADALGAGAGDSIELRTQDDAVVTVPVDGVYVSVYRRPFTGYWLRWDDLFTVPCGNCAPPAQPILVDDGRMLALELELGHDSATFVWQAPIADPAALSLPEAQALRAFQHDVTARISEVGTPLGDLFVCCREIFFFRGIATTLSSSIAFVIDDATERIAAVEGPTRVLEVAGIAVALVVVAAAGAFSVRARRVDAAWLFARGTPAPSVGLKTALECLLPCAAGGALGLGVAFLAVTALGPSATVDGGAATDAGLAALASVIGAIALISVVAAATYVRVTDPHGRRFARVAALVPWELGLALLAYLALRRLRGDGAFVIDEELGVAEPSLALVAFPFLFLAAFAILSARLARAAFGWLRGPTARAAAAPYLAVRRLAGGGAFAVLLVAAAGLCLGTFLNAQIVARSLQTTVDAKTRVFVGSDVQGRTEYLTPTPESFPYPITRVVRFAAGARIDSGRAFDLLAVDSRTLADAAFWDGGFSDVPIRELTERLRAPGTAVPVVIAGAEDLDVDAITIAAAETPVEVVAHTTAFPGMSSVNPLLVVDEATLLERIDLAFNPLRDPRASTELWVRGDPGPVRTAFAETEYPPGVIVTAEEVADVPSISAAIDTFVVVNALGLVAAALAFVGMLMYLSARQRSQIVSYALSARMGMRHGQHRRALLLELGSMLAWGFATGAVLAAIAASLIVPLLDPIPVIPPDPLLVRPLFVAAAAAVVVAVLAWLGAAWTNRRARSADLGEVMRVAE